MTPTLAKMAVTTKAWLLQSMLPLWSTAGFDRRTGQFVEALEETQDVGADPAGRRPSELFDQEEDP